MPSQSVVSSESSGPLPDTSSRTPMPGSLLRLALVNFMCHVRFTCDFDNHFTVIHGVNGCPFFGDKYFYFTSSSHLAGKSAIAVAIATALGAKASRSGDRGSKIGDLVRSAALPSKSQNNLSRGLFSPR